MAMLSENPFWEELGTRLLCHAVYGGADFGEVMTTVERIGDGDAGDWHREWNTTASRLLDSAASCADRGHAVSARDAYLRAAHYLRISYQPLYGEPVDSRLTESFEREWDAFAAAARLSDPPLELVEIPFEGASLPGLMAMPATDGAVRPTIVHTNGYDSDLTEMYFAHVPAALARGYNVLLFDGPGQGRNLIRDAMRMRPDWENVVRPVIDWTLQRPEVDPEKIVLAGWSFGGYLAPRAAAFEPRIAALIADPGQWDQRDGVVAKLPLPDEQKASFPKGADRKPIDDMEAFLRGPEGDPALRWRLVQRGLWVHGVTTLFDYFAEMTRYELSSVAAEISCPTLLTMAEGDPMGSASPKLFDAISAERKELVEFTAAEGAGGHCEATARRLYHQRVFDWLDETWLDPVLGR